MFNNMGFTKQQITLEERDDLLRLFSNMNYHNHIITSAETMFDASKAYYDAIGQIKYKYGISPMAMIHHIDWDGFLVVEIMPEILEQNIV